MTVDTKLMTAEELWAMPDDVHRELVRGELISMSPAGEEHSRIARRLLIRLGSFVEQHKLGESYGTDLGYILERSPDTVREPDVSFVRAERATRTTKLLQGAPDLAIEVISPNDTRSEVGEKVREYLAAGTQMVIVIYPRNQTATIHTPTSTTRLTTDDTLTGGDVVPGWSLPLRELFS
jgi:Uma2 family endonuclease